MVVVGLSQIRLESVSRKGAEVKSLQLLYVNNAGDVISCTDTRQKILITRLYFICCTVHNFNCFCLPGPARTSPALYTTGEGSNNYHKPTHSALWGHRALIHIFFSFCLPLVTKDFMDCPTGSWPSWAWSLSLSSFSESPFMFAEKEKWRLSLLGFVSYPTQTVSSKRIDYVICILVYKCLMNTSQICRWVGVWKSSLMWSAWLAALY